MKLRLTVHLDGLIRDPREDASGPLPKFNLGDFTVEGRRREVTAYFTKTRAEYVATTLFDFGQATLTNPPIVYEKVDALVTCFRLFKKGYMTAYPVVAEIWDETLNRFLPSYEFGWTSLSPQGGMVYGLAANEIENLTAFASKYLPVISSERLRSLKEPAFKFFNRGVDDFARSESSMAIIDFVSCVEALLGPGPAELTHRLSQNVAIVSERKVENRPKRYEEFKRLYQVRSRAVHGDDIGKGVGQVVFAETVARDVLLVCMMYFLKGSSKKQILEDVSQVSLGMRNDLPIFLSDDKSI